MSGNTIRFGSTDSANHAEYVVVVNPVTGLPITSFGGGGGSSDDPRLDALAAIDTKLEAVRLELVNSKSIADTIIQDSTVPPRFFIRQEIYNDTTGTSVVTIKNLDGTTPSPAPTAPLSPLKANPGLEPIEVFYSALTAGTGYSVGDEISNIRIIDDSGTVVASTWYNVSQAGTIATAPVQNNLAFRYSSGTAVRTDIASSTSSGIILGINKLRKGARLINNSTSLFYGLYGTGTASSSNYSFVLAPLTASPLFPVGIPSYEDIPTSYVGIINGVWASVNGNLLVTDFR